MRPLSQTKAGEHSVVVGRGSRREGTATAEEAADIAERRTIHNTGTTTIEVLRMPEQAAERVELVVRVVSGADVAGTASDETTVLAELIRDMFNERGATLGLMESCTGGMVASCLLAPEGSGYVLGGIVAYAAATKVRFGVPAETIERYGLVSNETAIAMARAAMEAIGADVGIGTTGAAGPGELEGHPPGTVHVGVVARERPGQDATLALKLKGDSEQVRKQATLAAMSLALQVAGGLPPEECRTKAAG